MTYLEMETRVWERLEESESDPARYSAADVLEYLNDAAQHLVSRAGLFVTTAALTQTAGALFVALPSDCISIENIARDSGPWFLEPTTVYHLDRGAREDANWRWSLQTAVGARAYFPFGLSEVALWPRADADGDAYTLTYRQDAGETTLGAGAADAQFPEDLHEALVDYAVARCLIVDGDLAGAATRMKLFNAVVDHARVRSQDVARAWERDSQVSLR